MISAVEADCVCPLCDRDLGKGGTVEHTFDKHSIDLEPGNPVRAELASLLVGNRTEPVYVFSLSLQVLSLIQHIFSRCTSKMLSFLLLRYVPSMFPNYIRAPNGADAKPVSQLYEGQRPQNYFFLTVNVYFLF